MCWLMFALTVLNYAAYMVNYFAFGQDVAPSHTGLVIGCLGGLAALLAFWRQDDAKPAWTDR